MIEKNSINQRVAKFYWFYQYEYISATGWNWFRSMCVSIVVKKKLIEFGAKNFEIDSLWHKHNSLLWILLMKLNFRGYLTKIRKRKFQISLLKGTWYKIFWNSVHIESAEFSTSTKYCSYKPIYLALGFSPVGIGKALKKSIGICSR
jgi:hypothetical protein